jgi:cyclase
VGDPINAVRIFNDKEVDELILLDISATRRGGGPPFELIADAASECFMPLGYGGGVRSLQDVERLFKLGLEKVVINTAAYRDPELIRKAASVFGNQSIVVSIDVRRTWLYGHRVYVNGGRTSTKLDPVSYARRAEDLGAGELFVNAVDRDGRMGGYDVELISRVSAAVRIPVVACGGAGSLNDIADVIRRGGASAASAGSLFIYHGKYRAVLISYPPAERLDAILT